MPALRGQRRRRQQRAHFGDPLLPPLRPSPASLIESLIHLSRSILSLHKQCTPRIVCQKRNIFVIVRRIQTLHLFLEELKDQALSTSPPALPPSAHLSFTELHVVLQGIKLMLEDCVDCSRMWLLVQHRKLSESFHLLTQEMATALDVLPLPLLDVSDEVREQVELVRRQARKSKVYIDPKEAELLACVQSSMEQIERRERPETKKLARVASGLKLQSGLDCEQELRRLEEEDMDGSSMWDDHNSAMRRSMKIPLNDLVSLVRYAKCVLYGATEMEERFEDLDTGEVELEGDEEEHERFVRVPEDFRCPISLEVMTDPVVVATGQTYDRASITKWMAEEKNQTCPKSGLKLLHTTLISNHALRSLIMQWSWRNNIRLPSVPASGSSYDASPMRGSRTALKNHPTATALEATKLTVELLLSQLPLADALTQRHIAGEIRLLAKRGSDNRKVIAEVGAIPALLPLLCATDLRTQEHTVTAILNLSIFPPNKARIVDAGGIDPLVEILESNSPPSTSDTARENAAATVFSLSQITEYAAMLGDKQGLLQGLTKLLREGSPRGRRDAACALFNIAVYGPNRGKVVKAGVVGALLECLERPGTVAAHVEEELLAVLAVLANSSEGREGLCSLQGSLQLLIDLIRTGNRKTKENAAAIALQLCRHGGYEMVAEISNATATFHTLLSHGTPRAKRKAASLLRLIFRCQAQFPINFRTSDPTISTTVAAANQDTGAYSSMMLSYTTAAH